MTPAPIVSYNDITYAVNEIIIELDEFDKTKKLKLYKKYKEHRESTQFNSLDLFIRRQITGKIDADNDEERSDSNSNSNSNSKSKCKELLEYDWDIDDLLTIICGSYIPEGRMTVATCNDLAIIKEYCPQLVRANRMTPIAFNYGDKAMFIQIIKDYLDLDAYPDLSRDGFKFSQAALTEFLLSRDDITIDCVMANSELFVIKANAEAEEHTSAEAEEAKLLFSPTSSLEVIELGAHG